MLKKIRNIIALLVVFVLCINLQSYDAKAEDASVVIALSSSTVSMDDSVSVTVTVSGTTVSQYTIYVTYDSSILQFDSASGAAQGNGSGGTITLCGGAGSTTLSFTAIGNGTSYISTSGTEVYDIDYNQLTISHAGASVTVATEEATTEAPTTEETTEAPVESTTEAPVESTTEAPTTEETTEARSSNCNLVSLQVTPGTLEPEFSYDVTSYTVNLEEDETSIIVSAETEDDAASTNVTGADELKPGANAVKVIVTAENGAVKIYNINVIVGDELAVANVDIDGKNYKFVTDVVGLNVPEGYSSTTLQYKDWEVLAFQSPNKKIVLVCLQDDLSNKSWFIYKEETDEFIPYNEFSPNYNRYIILNVPDYVTIPATYIETELMINAKKILAYKSTDISDENIYIVYAMNIDAEEGFYLYDAAEGTFLRYSGFAEGTVANVASESDATPVQQPVEQDDSFFNKKNLTYILIGVGVLALVFLILFICVAVKSKKYKDELEDAEGMIEQLVNVTGGKVNHEALDALQSEDTEDKKKKKSDKESGEKDNKKDKKKEDVKEEKKEEISELEDIEDIDISGPIETIKIEESDPSDDDTSKIDVQVISEIVDLDKEESERKTHDEAYNEFQKQSAAINFKIREDYDADKDSAFSDDKA